MTRNVLVDDDAAQFANINDRLRRLENSLKLGGSGWGRWVASAGGGAAATDYVWGNQDASTDVAFFGRAAASGKAANTMIVCKVAGWYRFHVSVLTSGAASGGLRMDVFLQALNASGVSVGNLDQSLATSTTDGYSNHVLAADWPMGANQGFAVSNVTHQTYGDGTPWSWCEARYLGALGQ